MREFLSTLISVLWGPPMLESWWGWELGVGLIENANFWPPTPDLLKQEVGEPGTHEQAPSDSYAYRRLRSADSILIIL